MKRLFAPFLAIAAILAATPMALAAPKPISTQSPVAGENIAVTDSDGNSRQVPAQVVVLSDDAGTLYTPSDASAANQTAVQTPVTPATATATRGVLEGCEYRSTMPTFTNAQQGAVQCGTRGQLQTSIMGDVSGLFAPVLAPSSDDLSTGNSNAGLRTNSSLLLFDGTTLDRWRGDSTGGAWVQGPAVSGATAAGNPVLGGCDYNATPPTVTTGQRVAMQCGTRGSLSVQLMAPDAGAVTAGSATADDISAGTPLATASRTFVYDPTDANWDRARMWQNAANISSTDSGLTAVGLMAQCDDVSITSTTENNAGNLRRSCTNGALVVRPYETAANAWNYAAGSSGIVNTTTAVTIKAAAGAGLKNCIVAMTLSHDALGGATEIALRDGAAGTVLWRGKMQTTAAEERTIEFGTPICGTANTLMEFVTLTAVTGGVYVNAQGYVAP